MTTLTLLDIPMLTATNTPTEPAAMAGEGEPGGDLALLGLMQLVSPALPIGALGWVNNEAELARWIEGVLEDGLSRCELPLLARLQTAWANDNGAIIAHWNQWLHATRETAELSDEDTRLGGALKTLLGNLNLLPERTLIPAEPGYITLFAWAAQVRRVPVRQTLLGFAWAWLENQLAVACKALPLGHTAAQRIIEQLRPALVIATDQALARQDHELGPILPGLALGSALHETQYSRLFRS